MPSPGIRAQQEAQRRKRRIENQTVPDLIQPSMAQLTGFTKPQPAPARCAILLR
jgi:hypothetical protein